MNKTIGILSVLALMFTLTACESNAVRHEEAFSKHQEWTEKDKQLISSGYVVNGMSKEMVRAAWGKPCETCTGTKKFETGVESWEFKNQVVFFDKDGKVTRVVDR